MKGRTDEQRAYGAQLDSLIDVVSFGVAPAVLLLSLGGFGIWFLPGAVIVAAASVVRLSYFNVFGLADSATYRGLALDNNMILLVFVFAFQRLSRRLRYSLARCRPAHGARRSQTFPQFARRSFSGAWYYVIAGYAVAMSALFGWLLLHAK